MSNRQVKKGHVSNGRSVGYEMEIEAAVMGPLALAPGLAAVVIGSQEVTLAGCSAGFDTAGAAVDPEEGSLRM